MAGQAVTRAPWFITWGVSCYGYSQAEVHHGDRRCCHVCIQPYGIFNNSGGSISGAPWSLRGRNPTHCSCKLKILSILNDFVSTLICSIYVPWILNVFSLFLLVLIYIPFTWCYFRQHLYHTTQLNIVILVFCLQPVSPPLSDRAGHACRCSTLFSRGGISNNATHWAPPHHGCQYCCPVCTGLHSECSISGLPYFLWEWTPTSCCGKCKIFYLSFFLWITLFYL